MRSPLRPPWADAPSGMSSHPRRNLTAAVVAGKRRTTIAFIMLDVSPSQCDIMFQGGGERLLRAASGCLSGGPPSVRSSPLAPQISVEPLQRPPPRFLGRRLVVAGGGVVVEAMVGALIDVGLVRDAGRRQRGVEGRPARGDALIEFAVLGVDRRLDFRDVASRGLDAV